MKVLLFRLFPKSKLTACQKHIQNHLELKCVPEYQGGSYQSIPEMKIRE